MKDNIHDPNNDQARQPQFAQKQTQSKEPGFDGFTPQNPPTASPPSAPTHNLCVKVKGKDLPFVQIGVAWKNNKGSFRIKLNPGTVISWNDEEELSLHLFQSGKKPRKEN